MIKTHCQYRVKIPLSLHLRSRRLLPHRWQLDPFFVFVWQTFQGQVLLLRLFAFFFVRNNLFHLNGQHCLWSKEREVTKEKRKRKEEKEEGGKKGQKKEKKGKEGGMNGVVCTAVAATTTTTTTTYQVRLKKTKGKRKLWAWSEKGNFSQKLFQKMENYIKII